MGNKELLFKQDKVSVLQNQKARILELYSGEGCTTM